MKNYEKLGAFYLGKVIDSDSNQLNDELLMYDSRDLTTHAICVGMTGSGKTGLCISMLEEAAIDGIPAIAIDPKGDLGNMLLSFPNLKPSDFKPWLNDGEASRQGFTTDEYSKKVADTWRSGLKKWDQDPTRIKRFRDSVDMTIYTPGSKSGLSVTALRSFDAPPPEIRSDSDGFRERILSAVSGLLGLLGIDADPIRSREHILISNILTHCWKDGNNLDLPALIAYVQDPPIQKVGVFDIEAFYPQKDRFELAILLNNLMASPGFATWLEGEPLNIQRFFYTPEGKPRLSIFSIAHLSEPERMFFVTLLLNEMVSWMRIQPGTSSLRAMLYIDEIYGYFPPTANPPSKIPMLTLLKQARAYGLGVVLSTQNPVDLDYKGLSNTGTWLIGKLQTEQDRDRLLDGIKSVALDSENLPGGKNLDEIISGLGKREFFMKNVHENQPILFRTRWALSYLRGPLTLPQIQTLMESKKKAISDWEENAARKLAEPPKRQNMSLPIKMSKGKSHIPEDIDESFLSPVKGMAPGTSLVYRLQVLGMVKLHFIDARRKIDLWQSRDMVAPFSVDGDDVLWDEARVWIGEDLPITENGLADAQYDSIPKGATVSRNFPVWEKMLKSFLYQDAKYELMTCPSLELVSKPGEEEGDFKGRIDLARREERDLTIEKLKKKYSPKLFSLDEKIRRAQERLNREKTQMKQQKMQTVISVGATILGALLGRKKISSRSIGRATTAMRGAGRVAREKEDIRRAEANLLHWKQELNDLQSDFEREVAEYRKSMELNQPKVNKVQVGPRKSDIMIQKFGLIWTPWYITSDQKKEPSF